MALYSYKCVGCEWSGDLMLRIADRDAALCPSCHSSLSREEIPTSVVVKADYAHTPGVILGDGRVIEGQFGRGTRKRKAWL